MTGPGAPLDTTPCSFEINESYQVGHLNPRGAKTKTERLTHLKPAAQHAPVLDTRALRVQRPHPSLLAGYLVSSFAPDLLTLIYGKPAENRGERSEEAEWKL